MLGGSGHDVAVGGNGDDTVEGGGGNDTLDGGLDNDLLLGDDGDDLIKGDAGDDRLFGGDGADVMDGGAGWDTLKGGAGDDTMSGGSGEDCFVFNATSGFDVIEDYDFAEDALKIKNTEFLSLGIFADHVVVTHSGGSVTLDDVAITTIAEYNALLASFDIDVI